MPNKRKSAKSPEFKSGDIVVFNGYTAEPDAPKLTQGERYAISAEFPTETPPLFDLSKVSKTGKAVGKPLDSVTAEEISLATVEGEETPLLVNDDPTPAPKAAKAKTTTAKDDQGKDAKGKTKAKKPEAPEESKKLDLDMTERVKLTAAPKAALTEAKGNPVVALMDATRRANLTYFVIGALLCEVRATDAHADPKFFPHGAEVYPEGQAGFEAFVSEHLGLEPRKAFYYASIYRAAILGGLTEKDFDKMGWSKAKEVARYILAGGEDVGSVLDEAKRLPYGDFEDGIKARMVNERLGGTRGQSLGSHKVTRFPFTVFNDQADVIRDALNRAAEELGIPSVEADKASIGKALFHIVSEWIMTKQD